MFKDNFPFTTFPDELLFLILQFLDWPDLKRARFGSKRLNLLVSRMLKYQWTKGKNIFKFTDAIADHKTILIDKSRILIIFKPLPYIGSKLSSDLYLYIYNVETGNISEIVNKDFGLRARCNVDIGSVCYFNGKLFFFAYLYEESWSLMCYDFKNKTHKILKSNDKKPENICFESHYLFYNQGQKSIRYNLKNRKEKYLPCNFKNSMVEKVAELTQKTGEICDIKSIGSNTLIVIKEGAKIFGYYYDDKRVLIKRFAWSANNCGNNFFIPKFSLLVNIRFVRLKKSFLMLRACKLDTPPGRQFAEVKGGCCHIF